MKKLSKYSGRLLTLLIVLTFCLLAVEVVKGPGSIGRHILIDSKIFWAVSLIWLFFVIEKPKVLNLIFKANLIILIPVCLVYFYYLVQESMHFPNFVLASYGVHLNAIMALLLFSLSLPATEKIKKVYPKLIVSKPKDIVILSICVLILYFFLANLTETLSNSFSRDSYIVLHTKSTYNEKMFYYWGDYYYLMSFVKNNTPPDAKIIIPPMMEPWLARTGDMYLDRAFLYPRELIQFDSLQIPAESLKSGNYVLVSWGHRDCSFPECHGWPRQAIKTKEVLYKDPGSDSVIEVKDNFLYQKDDYKYVYGLIKL